MAELQTLRSAFNGFNREDVVRYIEYINNKHNAQVAQLKNELDEVRSQLSATEPVSVAELELQLEESQTNCAALEAELAETKALLEDALQQQKSAQIRTEGELEAYRRAERAERLARERAEQLYTQANAALADATAMVDDAAAQLGTMANQVASQMTAFRDAVIGTRAVLADAAAAMYAIRPCTEDKN